MAEDRLPEDFDVIVLGTGFPESVVAAALSRIGMKVLHLDRNDYYSDEWVTFTFESLLKWIELNQTKDQPATREVKDEPEATGTHTSEAPSVEPGTYSVPVPSCSKEIKNVVVKSYFSELQPQQESVDAEAPTAHQVTTDASESAVSSSGPQTSADDPSETVTSEPNGVKDTSEKAEPVEDSNTKENSAVERTLAEGAEETASDASSRKVEDHNNDSPQTEKENESPASSENVVEETSMQRSEGEVPTNEDSSGSVRSPLVPPQRVRNETRPAIGMNMTYDDLKPYWRRFNIDISPKLLFSRGPLVEALISANISHYAEFKSVTRILTYMDGRVEEVPCSRADVFSSSVISIVEKRMLMKYLTFCLDFEQQQDQYEGFEDKPYAEFLQSRRLTANLQHFIIHAIAMVKPETPTLQGLKATQSFLQSLGRYGNTPFIWPLYGAGELPQAFCRMCAVFGGLYCLRRGASAITISEANGECTGIISDNQLLKCKWLISGYSYMPESFKKECTQFISRAVFITCGSLKASDAEFITVLSVPPASEGGEPVRVIELGPATMACPKGLYIVHLVSKSLSSSEEDLEPTVNKLFHIPSEAGDVTSGKPIVLWSLYFNQAIPDSMCVTDLPSNVHVLSLPGISLGFGEALQQAKEVFEKICPDEEFLQAVPNPEDIILDDFLQDGNQNAGEAEAGAQVDVVDPDSREDERPALETEQEDESDSTGRQASEGAKTVASETSQEHAEADGTDRERSEGGDAAASETSQEHAEAAGTGGRQLSEGGEAASSETGQEHSEADGTDVANSQTSQVETESAAATKPSDSKDTLIA